MEKTNTKELFFDYPGLLRREALWDIKEYSDQANVLTVYYCLAIFLSIMDND